MFCLLTELTFPDIFTREILFFKDQFPKRVIAFINISIGFYCLFLINRVIIQIRI